MAIGNNGGVGRRLRAILEGGSPRDLTDGQLLERSASGPGEAAELAFSTLVERHGSMVLRVCRGVLDDPDDALDAFQATFLVLVKKGRGLWVRDSLGPWLHQVALRTAAHARASAARRRRLERGLAEARPESARDPEPLGELARVVHEELAGLPDRYRSAVVLCDLEGRTHEQAARHLGCPVGTVKSRLTRAREKLRDGLSRRGFAPGAGPLWFGPSQALSPALADSAAVAAIRFASTLTQSRAIVPGAAPLAREVIRTMNAIRWMKFGSILLALGATATGAGQLAGAGPGVGAGPQDPPKAVDGQKPGQAGGPATVEVRPGKLAVTFVERGNLEPSKTLDVLNEVEGSRAIIRIQPEGSAVRKGQPLAELDSADLRDMLTNQQITTQQAKAAYEQARLVREVAEFAVKEYEEASKPRERAALAGQIQFAGSEVEKAAKRLERLGLARKQIDDILRRKLEADRTASDVLADVMIDLQIEEAGRVKASQESALREAKARLETLENFTNQRMSKGLAADVDRAKADELSKRASWELEKTKEAKLERLIARCVLKSPGDGVLVYPQPPRPGMPMIEEGATVRERQILFRVVDLSDPLRVNAKVHESIVDQVRIGMAAKVEVDAFPGQVFEGTVQSVAPLPDPNVRFAAGAADIKVYTTRVAIKDGNRAFRPGMSAKVEILAAERDNVLSVPVGAVAHFDDKDWVALRKPGGQVEWREVTLGISNGKAVEVKAGLTAGESVLADALAAMDEPMKRKVFGQPPRPTPPAGSPRP